MNGKKSDQINLGPGSWPKSLHLSSLNNVFDPTRMTYGWWGESSMYYANSMKYSSSRPLSIAAISVVGFAGSAMMVRFYITFG
jgi:hypothetical protein